MQDQQVTSLKSAVAQAMTEKEDTFEHLGEAREKNAELQDALREANSQLRMLQACLPLHLGNRIPMEATCPAYVVPPSETIAPFVCSGKQ